MSRFRPKVYGDDGGFVEQENRLADELGGHRQAGSGSSKYAKGDVKLDRFLIEGKGTKHASLYVKKKWLKKITSEATAKGKYPALAIEIEGEPDPMTERDWLMVPLSVWKEMLERCGWK